MAIKSIPEITVNDQTKIFGGYIYNVNFENGFSNSPTSITITFANEEGIYQKPQLNFNTPFNIKVGNQIDNIYYAVSYQDRKSSQGKLLEVKFWDNSYILDNIYIGLHKKHGLIPKNPNERNGFVNKKREDKKDRLDWFNPEFVESNANDHFYLQRNEDEELTSLIILGREFHPCDEDLNGVIDLSIQGDSRFKIDSCDPCPSCPEEKYSPVLDREKCLSLTCSEIFEVKYNFATLINSIQEWLTESNLDFEIDQDTIPETNDSYYASYEGNVRQVLQNWGSDYGFNFYTEKRPEDEKLQLRFFDTKIENDILEPEDLAESDITDFTESSSIENTQRNAAISLYQQRGERRTYSCENEVKINLSCVHLSDLFATSSDALLGDDSIDNTNGVDFEDVEVSCALSKYSSSMRDYFWWSRMYGVKDFADYADILYRGNPLNINEGIVDPLGKIGRGEGQGGVQIESPIRPQSKWIQSSCFNANDGIDGDLSSCMQVYAQEHGIAELGYLKPLCFVTPREINNALIVSNSDNTFIDISSNNPTTVFDPIGQKFNQIMKAWNPSSEDKEFFLRTPLKLSNPNGSQSDLQTIYSRGSFMLASRNDDLYNQIIAQEINLANNFIGRFWAKRISISDQFKICSNKLFDSNGNFKGRKLEDFNINLRGGGQFYFFDTEETQQFLQLPIFSFGHTEGSRIGQIANEIRSKTKIFNNLNDREFDEGIIFHQTSATWFPDPNTIADYSSLIGEYDAKKFRVIANYDDQIVKDLISEFAPQHRGDKNIKLFVIYPEVFDTDFSIDRQVSHPIDSQGSEKIILQTNRSRGCYGDCDNNEECFSGETSPSKIAQLNAELDVLIADGKGTTSFADKIRRELNGDQCIDSECLPNVCADDFGCGKVITIGEEIVNERECVEGQCVDKLGRQSSLCSVINIKGLRFFSPSHGFQTPKNKITLSDSDFRGDGYTVIMSNSYSEEVFVPKIEHIIQENIDKFDSSFASFNVNLYQVPIQDAYLFKENICEPDDDLLDQLHEKFNAGLVYDVDKPSRKITYNICGIDLVSDRNISVENGLTSFSIYFGPDGVSSTYIFSNQLAQPISITLERRLVELERQRKNPFQLNRDSKYIN